MAVIGIAALIAVMLEAAPALGATLALVLAVDVSASVTADFLFAAARRNRSRLRLLPASSRR